jgi:hypothetical protein
MMTVTTRCRHAGSLFAVATAALTTAALVSSGCDDASPVPDGGAIAGDAFVLGTRVWDDSATTSYFHVVPSLDADTAVDTSLAIEVAGAAKLFAIPGAGWFAIGAGDQPVITRYALDAAGGLVAGASISFQGVGVRSLWPSLYVVSPTKVYYPDRDGHQLVVWNPTTMEITGTIALPETARDGFLSLYSYTPIVRGDRLLFSVGWFDWNTSDAVLGGTGLVVIDTRSDRVERFDVDPRCGGISEAIVTASGDAYHVSSALAGAARRLGRFPLAPCALRIPTGGDAFDPGYALALGELTGGAIAGEPVPAGGSGIFLRVLDEALATVAEGDATWKLTGQAAWRWLRWDVATGTTTPVDLAPSTSDVLWFQVGDRVFGTETSPDYAQTTLIELTAPGGPRRALTAPGFLHGVARIR